ncbi:MAG: hypothetical protein ACXW36_11165 [Nitrospira sp.]
MVLVLLTITAIGTATIGHYGISADELTQLDSVAVNQSDPAQGAKLPGDLKFYGVAFDATAEAVYQIKSLLVAGRLDPPILFAARTSNAPFLERLQVEHVLTFALALTTYACVAALVGLLAGRSYAWLGPITLALFPNFWGHSFFNPKDIPFAAGFTCSTLLAAYTVGMYRHRSKILVVGPNLPTLVTILCGLAMGITTGIRIGGVVLPIFISLAIIGLYVTSPSVKRDVQRVTPFHALLIGVWLLVSNLCYPAYWGEPTAMFLDTLNYQSSHTWPGVILFDNRFLAGNEVPWSYIPVWLWLTTPPIMLGLAVTAFAWLPFKLRSFSCSQQLAAALLLAQVLVLPVLAILRHSTIYDGIRHFLFILPAVAALAASALGWAHTALAPGRLRAVCFIAVGAGLAQTALAMVSLHPLQYVYMNPIAGGLKANFQRYDADYWGLSTSEAIRWINLIGPERPSIVLAGHLPGAAVLAKPGVRVVSYQQVSDHAAYVERPFYYVALLARGTDEQKRLVECPLVYEVVRDTVPLTSVRLCE